MHLFFIILTCCLLLGCTPRWGGASEIAGSWASTTLSGAELYQGMSSTGISDGERVLIRRRLKAMIQKADYYALKWEGDIALNEFIELDQRSQGDPVVLKKAGLLAAQNKQFDKAWTFWQRFDYARLTTVSEKVTFLTSLLWSNISDAAKAQNLTTIPIDPATRPYWQQMLQCQQEISPCIESLLAYSGADERLLRLRTVALGADNVSDDFQYRRALIAGELALQEQWGATDFITFEILKARPDYLVALKLRSLALYHLGKYNDAKTLLLRAYEIDPSRADTAYLLGITLMEIEPIEHDLANLYLNKAVLNGYRPKTDLERRLAYNYLLLGDIESAFKIFGYLLFEDDVEQSDYVIAIMTALSESRRDLGRTWINFAREKWPQSDMILAFNAWILRLEWDDEKAYQEANASLSLNPNNPLALLQRGILDQKLGKILSARASWREVVSVDTSGVFVAEAQQYLDQYPDPSTATGSSIQ